MHMKYHNALSAENEYWRATFMEISDIINSLKVNQSNTSQQHAYVTLLWFVVSSSLTQFVFVFQLYCAQPTVVTVTTSTAAAPPPYSRF